MKDALSTRMFLGLCKNRLSQGLSTDQMYYWTAGAADAAESGTLLEHYARKFAEFLIETRSPPEALEALEALEADFEAKLAEKV